jgi:hypothetical protein
MPFSADCQANEEPHQEYGSNGILETTGIYAYNLAAYNIRIYKKDSSTKSIRNTIGKPRIYVRVSAKAKKVTMGCVFIHATDFFIFTFFGHYA